MKNHYIVIFCLLLVCCTKNLLKENEEQYRNIIQIADISYKSDNWEERLLAMQSIVNLAYNINTLIEKTSQAQFIEPMENLLLNALEDSHQLVVIEALKGFAYLSPVKAVPAIKKIAMEESRSNIRWYAIMALAHYKNSSCLEIFEKGLESKDWLIREASIKGLLAVDKLEKNNQIVALIIKSLKDPHLSVKIATLQNINIKDQQIYDTIIQQFNREKTFSNNILLESILIAFRGYELDVNTRNKVIQLLGHRNIPIRIAALRLLKTSTKK